MANAAFQKCMSVDCGAEYAVRERRNACGRCGGLLDVAYDWTRVAVPSRLSDFGVGCTRRGGTAQFSGVWQFHELLPFAPADRLVSIGEGRTVLQKNDGAAKYAGMRDGGVWLQYEGLNPSGSFKDNGMAAAFTHARMVGARIAACASTGNTSASLAMYAANAGLRAIVFVGSGKIAFGKLSQALESGALTLQIRGDFDDAMRRVREVSDRIGIYLMNSVNPFRLEGQKTIMFRILEGLDWEVPDWIVCPGGNLGNSSAFGKAFHELQELGLIDRIPRLAVINAAGANAFYRLYVERGVRYNGGRIDRPAIDAFYAELDGRGVRARTLASAIEIMHPVNLHKALRALEWTNGTVTEVSDAEIMDAKAAIGRTGLGCEPASAASLAGLRRLVSEGVIDPGARVALVLTGHVLKDPDLTVGYHSLTREKFVERYGWAERKSANPPIEVDNDIEAILGIVAEHTKG